MTPTLSSESCYAYQIDRSAFSTTVVFRARAE